MRDAWPGLRRRIRQLQAGCAAQRMQRLSTHMRIFSENAREFACAGDSQRVAPLAHCACLPLPTDVATCMNAQPIPCAQIYPDPRSRGYEPPAVEWLADDIRERGVLRPVLVRATERGYVIVHGERRWRAAKMLGLEVIPAYVVQGPAHEQATGTAPNRRQ